MRTCRPAKMLHWRLLVLKDRKPPCSGLWHFSRRSPAWIIVESIQRYSSGSDMFSGLLVYPGAGVSLIFAMAPNAPFKSASDEVDGSQGMAQIAQGRHPRRMNEPSSKSSACMSKTKATMIAKAKVRSMPRIMLVMVSSTLRIGHVNVKSLTLA